MQKLDAAYASASLGQSDHSRNTCSDRKNKHAEEEGG